MNKTVLVTGASRGLGFYFVKKYLEDGDTVFAGARDISADNLTELKKEFPDRLIPVTLDVADTKSVKEAAALVMEHTKKLDIVVNNAGIHSKSTHGTLEKLDVDDALPVLNTNSLGPLRVAQAFISLIRNSFLGKIINITSECGSCGTTKCVTEIDYSLSKAALNMETKLLSNYLKKDNIIVLAVHPGWMRTDMGGQRALLDPYETACQLVELFESINSTDNPIFIDNKGNVFPW